MSPMVGQPEYGQNEENKSLRKSLKRLRKMLLPRTSLRKKLLSDVIPPNDIGGSFDDTGALENVKERLKELVMSSSSKTRII
ncbi:unnamed protein product [Eruca vesicaria subsp. sativa]|uniref:Uncharacterized protein n=1 Tax=Eruca vesicaria subsp. sativa TaxID=29727 RepID=A0ABC8K452_ERUVS|nr:unnamed protein product [Eruca vesicaria subsp. sativa]